MLAEKIVNHKDYIYYINKHLQLYLKLSSNDKDSILRAKVDFAEDVLGFNVYDFIEKQNYTKTKLKTNFEITAKKPLLNYNIKRLVVLGYINTEKVANHKKLLLELSTLSIEEVAKLINNGDFILLKTKIEYDKNSINNNVVKNEKKINSKNVVLKQFRKDTLHPFNEILDEKFVFLSKEYVHKQILSLRNSLIEYCSIKINELKKSKITNDLVKKSNVKELDELNSALNFAINVINAVEMNTNN